MSKSAMLFQRLPCPASPVPPFIYVGELWRPRGESLLIGSSCNITGPSLRSQRLCTQIHNPAWNGIAAASADRYWITSLLVWPNFFFLHGVYESLKRSAWLAPIAVGYSSGRRGPGPGGGTKCPVRGMLKPRTESVRDWVRLDVMQPPTGGCSLDINQRQGEEALLNQIYFLAKATIHPVYQSIDLISKIKDLVQYPELFNMRRLE